MAALSLNPTVWGATRTTTFTTTVTGTPSEVIYIAFPTLTSTLPLEYTTLPSPSNSNSKIFPNGQPILVLTQVDGVIVDPTGQTISTATVVQAPPPLYPTLPAGNKINLVDPSYKWATWSRGERAGVIVAIVVAVLGMIAAFWYVCAQRRKRTRLEKDMEKGPLRGGNTDKKKKKKRNKELTMSGALGGLGRVFSRARPSNQSGPRGIEGLETVEIGPAARRSVTGEPSTATTRGTEERKRTRRSAHASANQESGSGERAPEVVEVARDPEGAVLPIGQRPLNPPIPNTARPAAVGSLEHGSIRSRSISPLRTEEKEVATRPHNPLVDDDDDDDMVSNHQ